MRALIALGLALPLLCACATAERSQTPAAAAVQIADLVSAVGSALAEAEPSLAKYGLALKSATVTVEAETSIDKSLGLALVVVSADASRTSQRSVEVSVALDVSSLEAAATPGDDSASLRKAIEDIGRAVTSRRASGSPAAFDSITVEIEFTVTSKLEGGLAVEVLDALKLEPERTASRTKSHTLSITLGRRTG
ncbi:MAG TPA: hypothetical protein VN783_15690 [Thermoanaerobaculia bacterium]|nr:hypothetical protein [Thermoanaerobaculia bacterium]